MINSNKGYTLIELVVVMTVIAIILGGSVLEVNLIDKDVYLDNSLRDTANIFDTSLSSYYVGLKTLPDTLTVLKDRSYIAKTVDLNKFEYTVNGDGSGYMLYALLSDGTKYLSPGSHFYEPPHFVEFTVPGDYTYTVPAKATGVYIELISGGGGGGPGGYDSYRHIGYGGGGGGGGAFTYIHLSPAPASIDITVDNGGKFNSGINPNQSYVVYHFADGNWGDLMVAYARNGSGGGSMGMGGNGGWCARGPNGGTGTNGQNNVSESGGSGGYPILTNAPTLTAGIPYGRGGNGESVTSTGVRSGGQDGQPGYCKITWY